MRQTPQSTTPTAAQFQAALLGAPFRRNEREAVLALHSTPNHEATASQLAALLGYRSHTVANAALGGAGHRVSDFLHVQPPSFSEEDPNWFSILADWFPLDHVWRMKREVCEAIINANLGTDLFTTLPEELDFHERYFEGASIRVSVNIYERRPEARRACIKLHKAKCQCCGFDFEAVYGDLGKGFIHVHHLVPLASIKKGYQVDPLKDLIPVCPNCHAMLHRRNPPLSIAELRGIISGRKSGRI